MYQSLLWPLKIRGACISLLLTAVFFLLTNAGKAATISSVTGSHILITLTTDNELIMINSTTTGIVVRLSNAGSWSGSVPGVSISGMTVTIGNTAKANFPEIRIVGASGKMSQIVAFEAQSNDIPFTNSFNIELLNEPSTTTFRGNTRFSGSAALSITTRANVSFYLNSSLTLENGDFTVSANMQATESILEPGSGFSMAGPNSKLEITGTGNIRITARGNGIPNPAANNGFSSFGAGISVASTSKIITTTGLIDLKGYGTKILIPDTTRGYYGIYLDNMNSTTNPTAIRTTGGDIKLYGEGSASGAGVAAFNLSEITTTGSGNINIIGYGSKDSLYPNYGIPGVLIRSGGVLARVAKVAANGTGNINIEGYGGGFGAGADSATALNSGVAIGDLSFGFLYGGQVLANGGAINIKGVAPSNITNGNQNGVYLLGSSTSPGQVVSRGGKVTIDGKSTPGKGYDLYVNGNNFISTETVPADIDLLINSFRCDNTTEPFVKLGAGKALRILTDDTVSINLGVTSSSKYGTLSFRAVDISAIPAATGSQMIFGKATHSGAINLLSPITNPGIDLVFAGSGNVISPRAAGSDINTSVRPWTLPANPSYSFRINGKAKDISYDSFEITGGVDLSGANLQLQGTYVPVPGDTFVLVSTTTGLQGTFSNFQHGDTLQFNGKKLTVLYSGTQCRLAADGSAPSVQVTLTSTNNGAAVCPGTPITFNASALYGGTNPTFTFFKNNVQVKSGSDSTYTLSNPANGDAVRVILVSSVSGINPNRDTSNTISLTVKATTSSTTNLSICSDQLPYSWNGLTFSAAGSQTKTGLTNAAGCDSAATLNLSVKVTTTSTSNLAICTSQLPYTWNGLTFNGAGTQTKTGLTNAAGCDSSATLNLSVKAATTSSSNLAICPAQLPYIWNGLTFSAAGTQTKTGLTNAAGCDSSATLVLSVRTTDTSVTNLSICSAQLPYSWNGLTFNAAGTQTKTGLSGSTGCDSAATLVLTVNNPTSSTTNLAICDNDLPYVWNGLTFNGAGTQTKTGLVNATGCDSTATLNLTLKNSTNSTTNLTICEGELPYGWNGLTFNTAGTQTKTGLTNSAGCDSSATLVLNVTPSTSSSTSLSICAFQLPYVWNGLTFNTAGTQTKTGLTNAAGCDSSATLTLSVYPTHGDTLIQNACVSFTWLGDTYTQTGFYQDTLISSVGCDSIVSLQLTILQPNAVNVSDTACGSFFWNNLTYTNSGVYNATFTNQFGCDSVVTLSLTINPILSPAVTLASTADTICAGASVTFSATANNGGTSPVYDFRLNGVSVQSGTSSTYTSATLANSDTITVTLTANNTCQTATTATSADKVMTVNPILIPTVTLAASDDTICAGTAVTFTATATNPGSAALYEFYLNNTSVQSNTSNTYSNSALTNQDSIWVVLTPTNTCQSAGTANSNQLKMVVNPLPSVTLGPISDMAISSDSVLLAFTPAGGTLSGPGISGSHFRPWTVDTGAITITYSVTNAQGCVASQSRTFNVQADAIVWDGSQWKYGTPGATQGSLDLMVLAGSSPAVPNGSACRNLVLRGGLLTHSLNNVLTINNNLNLRGGLMTGGGTLRFVNAAAIVTALSSSNEFRADIEIPAGANLQNINAFRLAPGSNVMAGSGTPNGGGTTSGSWTLVQRGSTQGSAWNAFSSPVVNGTGRMIQGAQHFSFDVASQAWQAWDSNLVMTNGRGYIARAATNGWFRGTLNNGAISFNVTKNASGSSWNLIGNPYPSQLSWSDFLTANLNINGTAYFMKSNVNVNNVVNDYTAINGLMIGAEIPVHQGFFVEANATGAINFTNAMRRAGRTSFYTRANQTVDLIWLKAFQQSDSAQASTTVVGFKADATTGFDRMYDGRLLKGDGSLFVYSLLNQEPMAIQGLPTLTAPVIVPLGVDANAAGTVVFRLDSTNMDPSVRILLEDLQTSTTHNLRQSAYQTQVAAGQNQSGRFRLLVNPFATTTPTIVNNLPIKLYAFNQTLVIDELQGRRVKEVRLTDLSGRVIENWQQPQGESRIELPTTAANGVYLLTVITKDGTVQTDRVLVRY